MFSFKTYFESHLQTYSLSQPNEKNYPYQNFYKPFFIITILSSLSSIFIIVLNFNVLFSNQIIYKNKIEKNILDLENNNLKQESQSFVNSNLYSNKFEEIIKDYRIKKNNLPKKFASLNKTNLNINTNDKKQGFINLVLPIAINQNQKILTQRQKLIQVKNFLERNKTLSKEDQKFIKDLSSEYLINTSNRHKIDVLNELLVLVDIIPNSIVLAQAANESGWGSSRFAKEYHALFGQYTYDSQLGVIPFNREDGEKYLIKFFPSFDKSVESYFFNINKHIAYSKFRKMRKVLRGRNDIFNINLLINHLDVYAKDKEYTKKINSIIRDNNLTQYDNLLSI